MALKSLNELSADQAYAVTVMRDDQMLLRPSPNPMFLAIGHTPVCTWKTLFELLGKGVVEVRPPLPGGAVVYGLAEAWWVDAA